MRTFPSAIVVAVALSGAGAYAQGTAPPIQPAPITSPSLRGTAQKQVDEDVERLLPIATAEAKFATTGSLGWNDWIAFTRWSEAAKGWKKEPRAGAAPLLAEGVLFDCLGRLPGVAMGPVGG